METSGTLGYIDVLWLQWSSQYILYPVVPTSEYVFSLVPYFTLPDFIACAINPKYNSRLFYHKLIYIPCWIQVSIGDHSKASFDT